MKCILLIYGSEARLSSNSDREIEQLYADHTAYGEALAKAGALRGGGELTPSAAATSVRFSGGKPRRVAGPFNDRGDQLRAYYLIEVRTLEEAISWAEKMPGFGRGTVEVRPLVEGS